MGIEVEATGCQVPSQFGLKFSRMFSSLKPQKSTLIVTRMATLKKEPSQLLIQVPVLSTPRR